MLAGPLCPRTGTLTASPPFLPARLRNGVKYCKVLRLPEVSGEASRLLSVLLTDVRWRRGSPCIPGSLSRRGLAQGGVRCFVRETCWEVEGLLPHSVT